MDFEEEILKNDEKAIFELRALYRKYGYTQYKMSKFEEYELYARNKDFLVSDEIITFTDKNGRLLALKPDVTLSIIKNTSDVPGAVQKVYYNENVYRVSRSSHTYREIMQTGLECIGDIGAYERYEVLMLAAESLEKIGGRYVLDVSHMGVLSALFDESNVPAEAREKIIRCIGQKNLHDLAAVCRTYQMGKGILEKVSGLISLYGPLDSVIWKLRALSGGKAYHDALDETEEVCRMLESGGCTGSVRLDFSIVNDMNYYSGLVFRGYLEGIPSGVLSGGQYDLLMRKMRKKSGAIGFAVYLDALELLEGDNKAYDADTVLLYRDGELPDAVADAVRKLTGEGRSVLVEKRMPEHLRCRRLLRLRDGRIETVEDHG